MSTIRFIAIVNVAVAIGHFGFGSTLNPDAEEDKQVISLAPSAAEDSEYRTEKGNQP